MFPFTSLSFTVKSPDDDDREISLSLEPKELAEGLQYTPSGGLPQLLEWFGGLQKIMHGRGAGEGWEMLVGTGSQDLIFKAVIAMVNPGDPVLVESPVYAGTIPMFRSLNCEQIEIETDKDGISTDLLRSILETWPSGKPKPKVLYTIPYGCNPSGRTTTLERREEVLRLAKEHDFIILEDDAYFYLYYGEAPRYPSYFALELEQSTVGRVLRFDSLSKTLSSGIRVGFASGPKPLLDAINNHTAGSNLQTSSLTQAIILKLFRSWDYEGFRKHAEKAAAFYRKRRDVFERAMQTHMSGIAEWITPEAGMFYWFKLKLDDSSSEGDSENIIRKHAFEKGVLALPGTVFLPNGGKTSYVRASFSVIGEDKVDEALKRLREAILEARQIKPNTK